MSNNAHVDPAAEALHLDPPGEVRLWEKLYALADRLPGTKDLDRAHFEEEIAERRRKAGDFDGSTQMYGAASRHTQESYKLKEYAKEIDTNKKLKLVVGPGAPPLLRELFLLRGDKSDSELARLADPAQEKRLADAVDSGRDISERELVLFGDLPTWRLVSPTFGVAVRSGPRTTRLRADELRYEGTLQTTRGQPKPPAEPTVLVTSFRARRATVRLSVDQSPPPPGWRRYSKDPPQGGGEAGVAFAINRIVPDGGIERGAPAIVIAHAVLLAGAKVRLVQVTRDGEHHVDVKQLAEAPVGARAGRRSLEVGVDAATVTVTVDGKRTQFPWKPDGDGDGFIGFLFDGVGYASLAQPSVKP